MTLFNVNPGRPRSDLKFIAPLPPKPTTRSFSLDGCPMFAPAYMG